MSQLKFGLRALAAFRRQRPGSHDLSFLHSKMLEDAEREAPRVRVFDTDADAFVAGMLSAFAIGAKYKARYHPFSRTDLARTVVPLRRDAAAIGNDLKVSLARAAKQQRVKPRKPLPQSKDSSVNRIEA